jgi:hypothetical protein
MLDSGAACAPDTSVGSTIRRPDTPFAPHRQGERELAYSWCYSSRLATLPHPGFAAPKCRRPSVSSVSQSVTWPLPRRA